MRRIMMLDRARQNTVPAINQVSQKSLVRICNREGAKLNVLFVGNSITYHEIKSEIGWFGSWGMAASSAEEDYVHQTVKMLEKHFGNVSFAIAQLAQWELTFDAIGEEWKNDYRDIMHFKADVVVIRMGENIPEHKISIAQNYIHGMINFFSQGCRQIIVTDCFWQRKQLDQMISELCDECGYTYCCISDLQNDERTMALGMYEHEGVAIHPSDYGMRQIARRISEKVNKKDD